MDNLTLTRLLSETADLLEISGADSFRVRSYRRAADAAEQSTVDLASLANDPARLLEVPGIGKSMAANIKATVDTGSIPLRDELLAKYSAGILDLLKLPGMGPKTIALLWDAGVFLAPANTTLEPAEAAISSIDQLASAIDAGRLAGLPRMGEKQIEKLRRGIDEFRKSAGRFRIDEAEESAERVIQYLLAFPGIERVTPAGSLRRGRETCGDLDLLVTGPACEPGQTSAAIEYTAAFPGIRDIIAKGENKVSFYLANSLQVDVRLLPSRSYGAALQYFTGSKAHNVTLRQRALKVGYTLSEWALARLDDESVVASETEESIYAALGLDWMPPELRENLGEIDVAAQHKLPRLIEQSDIRGDVHMHTYATDGRNSIREMADAALARGYQYIAITDHSKNLAMTNGLNEERALEHIQHIREIDREMTGQIRVFPGIEVDILGDGELDLPDSVLAQMDVVIASIHTLFNQPREQMTERILRAIENPYVRILGHPTGRLLLRREPFALDLPSILRRAAELGVAVEHNAAPERLDLSDRDLRLAKELGCKISVNTDSHDTRHFDKIRYGIRQLRRAWLTPGDVLNTLGPDEFLAALRPHP
ncbi:DNA polymerase/3'-5' exonuclease PolX [Acidicapsa dinghuensis]|uniref:DNA polymerase beta n=1 Tax=Acidicapsa dinghuensis TaxID=2218256 RepID=A0ABW1EKH0_9BACT|nr:DNA polymerase/3'-5' exonuclease PolX [Acidicapsa dinghuensis]